MTRDILTTRWNELGQKLVTLAEEFPAGQYDHRPTAGVRTFAEQLRHIAFWNRYVEHTLLGKPADGEANELPAREYPSRAKIVAALRESFEGVTRALAKQGATPEGAVSDLLLSFLEHNGEHYGQLVLYYRMQKLVPPASRAA